jgi:hypothetical protein
MWIRFGNGVLESWKTKSQLLLAENALLPKWNYSYGLDAAFLPKGLVYMLGGVARAHEA